MQITTNHKSQLETFLKANENSKEKKQQPKCFEAQENVGDQVMIGFSFETDWLREWCKFSGPITVRSKAKQMNAISNYL